MQFGEVNWDDAAGATGSTSPRIPFLIMKDPGDYQVRVVSKPFVYYHHWINDITGAQKKVNCTADIATCPICKAGTKESKAKPHWLFKVISRLESDKQGKVVVNVLDCGSQILTAIADYNKDPNWGSIIQYDITIKRGQKGKNPLYTVHPLPKVPLTAEEKEAIKATIAEESETYIDLQKIGQPWSAERINGVVSGTPTTIAAAGPSAGIGEDFESALEETPAQTTAAQTTTAPQAAQAAQTQAPASVEMSAADDDDFLQL